MPRHPGWKRFSRCWTSGLRLLPGLVLGLLGCHGPGEDQWQHFQDGGLYQAGTPSASPDGQSVVYSSPVSGHGDIYRTDHNGQVHVRLTNNDDFESSPIYAPDGSKIFYVREHLGERHLWRMNTDGSEQTQLTRGSVLDDLDGFSPDGHQIRLSRSAIGLGLGRFAKPYTIGLDHGSPIELPASSLPWNQSSPDGLQQVVSTYDAGTKTRRIFLSATDGSNRRQIGSGLSPTFSTDGQQIFYLNPPYSTELFVMDLDGRNSRQVALPPGTKTAPRVAGARSEIIVGVYLQNDRVPTTFFVDSVTLQAKQAW